MRGWRRSAQATARNRSLGTCIVLVVAVIARLAYWLLVGGPLSGGDSGQFIRWSGQIAAGSLSEPLSYPLHQAYSVLLVPMHLLPVSHATYVLVLHLTLSVATVWLLIGCGRQLVSHAYGLLIGVAAAVNPLFLFWVPYVLTETLFLFALALHVRSFLTFVSRPTAWHAILCGFVAVLVFVSRPVAFPILLVSVALAVGGVMGRRWGSALALKGFVAMAVLIAVLGAVALLMNPPLRLALLRNATVAQSLWLSTRVSTNNIDEILTMQDPGLPPDTPEHELIEYKVAHATRFIADHPWQYLAMAAKRFVAFWYPWLFARWSLAHNLIDAVLSLALTLGALALLIRGSGHTRRMGAIPIAFALSLALLTAFSQIDSDGRYRLPSELLLLVVAPYGWWTVWRSARPQTAAMTLPASDESQTA